MPLLVPFLAKSQQVLDFDAEAHPRAPKDAPEGEGGQFVRRSEEPEQEGPLRRIVRLIYPRRVTAMTQGVRPLVQLECGHQLRVDEGQSIVHCPQCAAALAQPVGHHTPTHEPVGTKTPTHSPVSKSLRLVVPKEVRSAPQTQTGLADFLGEAPDEILDPESRPPAKPRVHRRYPERRHAQGGRAKKLIVPIRPN
jgi:hypothetical protein